MIIKKFSAKTEDEAVEAAKKELGNGIVIMNVKNVKAKGLFGFLKGKQTEVTVALEEDRESLTKIERTDYVNKSMGTHEKAQTSKLEDNASINASDIEKKLDNLQSLLENQIKTEENSNERRQEIQEEKKPETEALDASAPKETFSEQDKFIKLLYNTMIDNEVDEKYANQVMEDIQKNKKPNVPFDYLLASVYQKMILKFGTNQGIVPSQKGPQVVVFIGPTGVGKTTTIAKLASNFAVEEKKKIALFTTDTYRIAATEQLRTYADILEVPFRVIYTEEELIRGIESFQEYDYIFVDTAGHSHQNEEQLSDMKKLIDSLKDKASYQCFLVLSATTKYRDLLNIAANYEEITSFQLIFTKLDETTTFGNLLNLKLVTNQPIAYVTYGQNVPNDIEPFNAQKTVKQLLGGKNVNVGSK